MDGNVALVAVSLLAGWAALWPARRQLGAAYHLLAFPAGLLAWPCVAAAAALAREGFGWGPAVLGIGALVAVSAGVLLRVGLKRAPGGAASAASGPAGFVVTGAGVLAATVAFRIAGFTASGYDSVFHYELPGMWLHDTGRLNGEIMGAFSPLIPSLHAGGRALGAEWTFVVYPMLALTVLATLAYVCRRWAFAALAPRPRTFATAATVALLASVPAFAFHAFYVHSQMITAAYLIASLAALRAAEDTWDASRRAWLAVAGLMGAGVALARPDGLAYAFVPIAVAAIPSIARRRPGDAAAFLTPPGLVLAIVYGAAYARIGAWPSHKLTGAEAGVLLVALALAGALWFAAAAASRPVRLLRSERHLTLLAYGALAAGVAAVAALKPADTVLAATNLAGNLFGKGGYGYLWYSLAALVALTLAVPGVRRGADWAARLLLALTAFLAIGLAVHGATHPGRLSPADSFNRVAFHAVPVVIWYLGAFVGRALAEAPRRSVAGAVEPGRGDA